MIIPAQKYANILPQYEELKHLKADKVERDFSPESLVYQEQKKLLREKFSHREKEVDDVFGNYGTAVNLPFLLFKPRSETEVQEKQNGSKTGYQGRWPFI